MSLVIAAVSEPNRVHPYRHMTFPAMRHLLEFQPGKIAPLAVAAVQDGTPAGLALAYPAEPGTANLLSLFVEPEFRAKGIGTMLVQGAQRELRALGIRKVAATYMTGQPGTGAVERILVRTGWGAPETRMYVVRCTLESVRSAPWLHRYDLPEGYEVVPWVELGPGERERIRSSHQAEPWIAADLVPFDHEQGIEPVTSLALRVHGEVLGWCLNHVVEDVLRFTCSFVRRDLQRLGRIVLLYSESVARAPRAGMSVGSWTVPVGHAGMAAFARRHMKPYSIFFGETRGVTADLATAPAVAAAA